MRNAFSLQQTFLRVRLGKAKVLVITLTVVSLSPNVTVSQYAQYQDLETEAGKWNSGTINIIIHTCAFPTLSSPIVFCAKGVLSNV